MLRNAGGRERRREESFRFDVSPDESGRPASGGLGLRQWADPSVHGMAGEQSAGVVMDVYARRLSERSLSDE